jgi:hypothetical protein
VDGRENEVGHDEKHHASTQAISRLLEIARCQRAVVCEQEVAYSHAIVETGAERVRLRENAIVDPPPKCVYRLEADQVSQSFW